MSVDLSTYPITHTTHPVWGKIPAILEALEKYPSAEWVWWLDIDAVIMSLSIDLYDHLLHPTVLRRKLVSGEPILIIDENLIPSQSGVRTEVPPTKRKLIRLRA